MLVVGGVVMTTGLVIFASSTGNATFYLAAALLGLGYGLSMALIPAVLINNWFVARRGLVLGIVLAGSGVGGVIWAAIGPLSPPRHSGGAGDPDHGGRHGNLHGPAGALPHQGAARRRRVARTARPEHQSPGWRLTVPCPVSATPRLGEIGTSDRMPRVLRLRLGSLRQPGTVDHPSGRGISQSHRQNDLDSRAGGVLPRCS